MHPQILKVAPFNQFTRFQPIAIQPALEAGDGFTAFWGAREVDAIDFHAHTMA